MDSRAATEKLTKEIVEAFERFRGSILYSRIEKVVSKRVHYSGAMLFLSASTERCTTL